MAEILTRRGFVKCSFAACSGAAAGVSHEEIVEYMKTVQKPWMAFKVLAAGAIHPKRGFSYAFRRGADFLHVGMFDFQIAQDCQIAREILAKNFKRQRPWRA